MTSTKETIKKTVPSPLIDMARGTWDAIGRMGEWPGAVFHPWRRDSNDRLKAIKGRHKGERCFIIGNGPSLNQTDLGKLRNEYTIGMNRFYLMFPVLGFASTYYAVINSLVIEQCAEDIQKLNMPRFVAWRGRKWLKPDDDLFFLYTSYTGPKFGCDLTKRLWEGATVTYFSMQVAYYLGFKQVILIGVDHSFVSQGKPNATVISRGDDPNHFSPKYFGAGFRWQLPDLETSEKSYSMARRAYEEDGREIIDATTGGKLQVFRKVEYSSLF
jgi:hypothetical protein